MAESICLASSILTLASFGVTIVKTLRSFSGSYTGAEHRIKGLSDDVELTVSILTELSATVEEYEAEFKITVRNFRATREICERNFGRLETALRGAMGRKEERSLAGDEGKGKEKEKKMNTWEKLSFALGGEDEMRVLVADIETAKSNLALLLDWVKLFILKELSKK